MVAIQLRGTVQRDGTVVLKLPAEVNPGEHEMVTFAQKSINNARTTSDDEPTTDLG